MTLYKSYFTSVYVIYYKCEVSIAPLIMRVHKVTVTFNFLARRPDTLLTVPPRQRGDL